MMKSTVVLFLIVASVLSASFWVSDHESNPYPRVVVKADHVVVEYDSEGHVGNTKVSVSQQQHGQSDDSKEGELRTKKSNARDLVCDSHGNCKHKVAARLEKANQKTKNGVGKGIDKVKEVVGDAVGKVKESSSLLSDVGREEMVEQGKSKVKDAYEKVKDSTLVDTPKRAAEDVERNVTQKLGWVKQFMQRVTKGGVSKLKETAKQVEEKAADGTKEGAHRMTEAAKRAGGLASDTLKGGEDMVRLMAEKTSGKKTPRNRNMFDSVIGVVYLLGFSMAFGMSIWMTFVSPYILGAALPPEQFGMLQTKSYPIYFKLQAASIAVAFIAHILSRGDSYSSSSWEKFHATDIIISLVMSLVNLLYLEPRATQVMFKRIKLEKDAGRGRITSKPASGIADDAGEPVTATTEKQDEVQSETQTADLSEKLRTLNRISSYINTLTIAALSLHMVYLGQRIYVNCD